MVSHEQSITTILCHTINVYQRFRNFAKEAREAVVACAAQNTQEQQAVEAAKVKARCCRTTTLLYSRYTFSVESQHS